jgi:hypothetical protein
VQSVFSVRAAILGHDDEVDGDYCCEAMRTHVEYRCSDHPDPYDCPDNVVVRTQDGSFGLPVHDGGQSHIVIRFCPWCGAALPAEEFDYNSLNPEGVAFGCEYCADFQNRNFGHVNQIGSDAARGLILIRCPMCRSLYENTPEGEDVTRRLDELEARDLYPDAF